MAFENMQIEAAAAAEQQQRRRRWARYAPNERKTSLFINLANFGLCLSLLSIMTENTNNPILTTLKSLANVRNSRSTDYCVCLSHNTTTAAAAAHNTTTADAANPRPEDGRRRK